jgi:F-type H+-transporting ATPase subunit a
VIFAGHLVSAADGGGFVAPGPGSFDLPPVFTIGGVGVTKPMLLLILAGVVVLAFFVAASR